MPEEHAVPHAPQWLLSLCRSRHTPEQSVSGEPHDTAHVPAEHTCPAGHRTPHPPQFVTSVARSRHVPEHSVSPVGQLTAHTPSWQI